MSEIISLKGLKLLSEMDKNNLPSSWKILILNYLQHKESWINSGKKIGEYNTDTFVSAIDIARKMGILWSVKRLRA